MSYSWVKSQKRHLKGSHLGWICRTLNAHLLECVGLAANMIGVKKRAIIIRMGSGNLVLFNPVLLEKKKPYQTEEGCLCRGGSRPTTRYEISVAYQRCGESKSNSIY